MEYKGCAITINRCQDRGWGGYWDYVVTKPGESQKVIGRSRGLKKEVVSMLKWKIDNNEMFPHQEGKLTQRAPDAGDSASFLNMFYPIFNLLEKARRNPPQRG